MLKAIVTLLLMAGTASAESHYISVPGENWSLKLDGPGFQDLKGKASGRLFQYIAASETGVTISLYTELEGGESSGRCKEIYWTRTAEDARLKKEMIESYEDNMAKYVIFVSSGRIQGVELKSASGHAYFVKDGLCVDFHVSHWPYGEGSRERVKAVLNSISIVE